MKFNFPWLGGLKPNPPIHLEVLESRLWYSCIFSNCFNSSMLVKRIKLRYKHMTEDSVFICASDTASHTSPHSQATWCVKVKFGCQTLQFISISQHAHTNVSKYLIYHALETIIHKKMARINRSFHFNTFFLVCRNVFILTSTSLFE